MENRNVTTFVKIVEAGSFTKAAELLGYSQAAVTAQIKAMEKEHRKRMKKVRKEKSYVTILPSTE